MREPPPALPPEVAVTPIRIQVRRVRAHAPPLPLPRYQSEQAAGLDLCADIDGEWTLAPLARRAVPTGIAIALPEGLRGAGTSEVGAGSPTWDHLHQRPGHHRRRLPG